MPDPDFEAIPGPQEDIPPVYAPKKPSVMRPMFPAVLAGAAVLGSVGAAYFILNGIKGDNATPSEKELSSNNENAATGMPRGFSKDLPWREDFVIADGYVTSYSLPESSLVHSRLTVYSALKDREAIFNLYKGFYSARGVVLETETNPVNEVDYWGFKGANTDKTLLASLSIQPNDAAAPENVLPATVITITEESPKRAEDKDVAVKFPPDFPFSSDSRLIFEMSAREAVLRKETVFDAKFASGESMKSIVQDFAKYLKKAGYEVSIPELPEKGIAYVVAPKTARAPTSRCGKPALPRSRSLKATRS